MSHLCNLFDQLILLSQDHYESSIQEFLLALIHKPSRTIADLFTGRPCPARGLVSSLIFSLLKEQDLTKRGALVNLIGHMSSYRDFYVLFCQDQSLANAILFDILSNGVRAELSPLAHLLCWKSITNLRLIDAIVHNFHLGSLPLHFYHPLLNQEIVDRLGKTFIQQSIKGALIECESMIEFSLDIFVSILLVPYETKVIKVCKLMVIADFRRRGNRLLGPNQHQSSKKW